MDFKALFPDTKPVIAMLHLKSSLNKDALTRAREEIDIYLQNGVEAVMVENYFGSVSDCEKALRYLNDQKFPLVYGVNILSDMAISFELSKAYGAKLIQIDSVCGHLWPDADRKFAEKLGKLRETCGAAVLGGVRFKYQPVNSGRTVEEDLALGSKRCEAVVVTGEGTGIRTPMGKVKEFREVLGDFPLIVGAGVTKETVKETFALSDGAIVGSYFKENHTDIGDVYAPYVREFMEEKHKCEKRED